MGLAPGGVKVGTAKIIAARTRLRDRTPTVAVPLWLIVFLL
jgi:hypothetical protein